MFYVHFPLNVLSVTADFRCHADGQLVLLQQQSDFGYQGSEFKTCADIAFALAELYGQRLHIIATTLHEFLIGIRFFHRGNVLTLQVLCYCHFFGGLVRDVQNDSRNFFQPCHEGGTVTAFSENDFEAVCVRNGAHSDRLYHPLLTNTFG